MAKDKFFVRIIHKYEDLETPSNYKEKLISSYGIQEKYIKEIESFLINLPGSAILEPFKKKKVRCVETNIIFESKLEAAVWLKKENLAKFISSAEQRLRAVCNGRSNKAYGYHWEYVNN